MASMEEIFHDAPHTLAEAGNFWEFLLSRCREEPAAWLPGHRKEIFQSYLLHLETEYPGKFVLLDIKYNSMQHANGTWRGLLDPPDLFFMFRDLGVPVLHLRRRNILKMVISRIRADQLAQHVSFEESGAHPLFEVKVPEVLLEMRCGVRDASHVDSLLKSLCQVREVYYEDLWLDHPGGARNEALEQEIQVHLGAAPVPLDPPRTTKQTPEKLAAVISNYDELSAALKATSDAWMLES